MKAVIEAGSKQYSVAEGDEICVELMEGVEVGAEISFDKVLLITGEQNKIGSPMVSGASVKAKVLDQVKGPKCRCMWFRRRLDSRTVKGHRQKYLKVKITSIVA